MEVTIRKGIKRRLGREELRTARVLSDTFSTLSSLILVIFWRFLIVVIIIGSHRVGHD